MNNPLWHVQLSDTHPQYQQVSLCRRPGYPNHEVVIVNAQKLIQYSGQDICPGYVIKPVEEWPLAKRQGLFEFLAPPKPYEHHVEMPIISFNEATIDKHEPWFWLFRRKREQRIQYVSYINGRHRTSYLVYAGAKEIPVMCHKNEVSMLNMHCTNIKMST
jgi:hypothetical protein